MEVRVIVIMTYIVSWMLNMKIKNRSFDIDAKIYSSNSSDKYISSGGKYL